MKKTIDRIAEFIKYKGISMNSFDKEISAGNGYIGRQIKNNASIGTDVLEKIIGTYEEVDPLWLITGDGDMLKINNLGQALVSHEPEPILPERAIPYFNIPVMAGNSLTELTGALSPDGYIKDIPGLENTEAIFPIRGCSMQPEVKEGAIVGVRRILNIESLNTQYKYLIVTTDDRMIKYIKYDKSDKSIILCMSPNFSEFPVKKSDILEIHRVTLVINPE